MDENKDVRQAEPQNAPQDKQPAPLSEARKTALLRYMAVLFAVAFLLVLLSLILQAHSSKATISELTQTSSSALSARNKSGTGIITSRHSFWISAFIRSAPFQDRP